MLDGDGARHAFHCGYRLALRALRLSRSRRFQPHFLKVLRKLTEDVPSFALLSGRAFEQSLQCGEDCAHGVWSFSLRNSCNVGNSPNEFHFVDSSYFPTGYFKFRPHASYFAWHLRLDMSSLFWRQAVVQLQEDRVNDLPGSFMIDLQFFGNEAGKPFFLHGSFLLSVPLSSLDRRLRCKFRLSGLGSKGNWHYRMVSVANC